MAKSESRSELMSAVTTEHLVLQTALSTTINEGASRSSLYVTALASALVAMGFMASSKAFLPFVGAVLPTIFLLGLFTTIRLVDITVENLEAHIGIARIRAFYRDIGGEAMCVFNTDLGRWPEGTGATALKSSPALGDQTTAASMVACVNAFVAGIGITLLAFELTRTRFWICATVGAIGASALVVAFYVYQRHRANGVDKSHDGQQKFT